MSERSVQMLICKPAAVSRDDFADPTLPGWDLQYVKTSCDGDIVKLELLNVSGRIQKTNISVDASKYKFLVVRLKGNGYFWIMIYDGAFKTVQTDILAPSTETIYVYDLSALTSGTITAILLGASGGVGKIAYYDFFLFVESLPFYSAEDLGDVLDVPQLKNGLNGQSD